jgi:hypothetical protein
VVWSTVPDRAGRDHTTWHQPTNNCSARWVVVCSKVLKQST